MITLDTAATRLFPCYWLPQRMPFYPPEKRAQGFDVVRYRRRCGERLGCFGGYPATPGLGGAGERCLGASLFRLPSEHVVGKGRLGSSGFCTALHGDSYCLAASRYLRWLPNLGVLLYVAWVEKASLPFQRDGKRKPPVFMHLLRLPNGPELNILSRISRLYSHSITREPLQNPALRREDGAKIQYGSAGLSPATKRDGDPAQAAGVRLGEKAAVSIVLPLARTARSRQAGRASNGKGCRGISDRLWLPGLPHSSRSPDTCRLPAGRSFGRLPDAAGTPHRIPWHPPAGSPRNRQRSAPDPAALP